MCNTLVVTVGRDPVLCDRSTVRGQLVTWVVTLYSVTGQLINCVNTCTGRDHTLTVWCQRGSFITACPFVVMVVTGQRVHLGRHVRACCHARYAYVLYQYFSAVLKRAVQRFNY